MKETAHLVQWSLPRCGKEAEILYAPAPLARNGGIRILRPLHPDFVRPFCHENRARINNDTLDRSTTIYLKYRRDRGEGNSPDALGIISLGDYIQRSLHIRLSIIDF